MLARADRMPLTATETEAAVARKAAERLGDVAKANRDVVMHVEGFPQIVVPLPAKALQVMVRLLEAMGDGQPISIIPHEAELTTAQAADYLNVSRPFVCKLIDDGKLPARMVNRHRRTKFADLLAFEEASQKQRYEALAAMVREERELGLE